MRLPMLCVVHWMGSRYALAQPLAEVVDAAGVPVVVFFATEGIPTEMAFSATTTDGKPLKVVWRGAWSPV